MGHVTVPAVPWILPDSPIPQAIPHHLQCNGFAEALVSISKKLMEKSIKNGKPWNYGLLQYWVTPISSTIPSPLEALTSRRPRTSLPLIPTSIGNLWKVPGFARNSSNVNLVLPPATAWNSNQNSLFSWRKCMEMSGRLESLTSQPRSLIPTGSSFQTVPSWEGPTRWSNPDHYLLILSWKVKPKERNLSEFIPSSTI